MSGLEVVARSVVTVTDICAVGRGAGWKDLHIRGGCPGGGGPGYRFNSDAKGITLFRPVEASVTWAEVRDLIEAGLTTELLAEANDAYRTYCEVAGESINRTHAAPRPKDTPPPEWLAETADRRARSEAASRRMAAVQRQVVANGLRALSEPDGQLALFAPGVS
jgi:hypothetical protein